MICVGSLKSHETFVLDAYKDLASLWLSGSAASGSAEAAQQMARELAKEFAEGSTCVLRATGAKYCKIHR